MDPDRQRLIKNAGPSRESAGQGAPRESRMTRCEVSTSRIRSRPALAVMGMAFLWLSIAHGAPDRVQIRCGRTLVQLSCTARATHGCRESRIDFRRDDGRVRVVSGLRYVPQPLTQPITAQSISCLRSPNRHVVEVYYSPPASPQEATVRYFSTGGHLIVDRTILREFHENGNLADIASEELDWRN
jgi:hypothetical protein